jgi:hypothetical protein
MPLFESQAVDQLQLYTQADVLFSRDPDPSSSVLYFPGLMQARRLRLHRHRCTDWSCRSCWTRWSPRRCSQIIISRLEELHPGPGKKDCFFPEIWIHPGTPLCSSQVFSSGQQLPRLRCVLYYIFRAKGPFRLDSKNVK